MPMSKAAHAVHETPDLLHLMVDAVEDYAIYLLGVDGTVLSWNSGAHHINGYTPEEIIGSNFGCFFSPTDVAAGAPQEELRDAAARGKVRKEAWRYRKGGHRFWAAVTTTALRDHTGQLLGFTKLVRDLTDKHEQQEALRRAKEEAQVASQAKSEFLANMSHELRTPLNAILGFSELLLTEIAGSVNDKQREYLSHVHDSGSMLLALINDVLDVSKLDARAVQLELKPYNLNHIAQRAIGVVSQQAQLAQVRIDLEVPDNLRLHCDERRMTQIMLNLLSNAIKFTPERGRINVQARQDAGAITLWVQDTGIGMRSEDIPRALARFGQIESAQARKHKGTGLGLPLVRQLVELHGGTFDLKSQQGAGTLVTMVFPTQSLTAAQDS